MAAMRFSLFAHCAENAMALAVVPDAVLACALAPKALIVENGFATALSGKERCLAVLKPLDESLRKYEGEQSVLIAGGAKVQTAVWDDVAVSVWGSFENLDYLRQKVEVEGEPMEAELVARLFRKFGEAASLTKIWGACRQSADIPSSAPRVLTHTVRLVASRVISTRLNYSGRPLLQANSALSPVT